MVEISIHGDGARFAVNDVSVFGVPQ